jgi:rhodanese-related sulfurtransferase
MRTNRRIAMRDGIRIGAAALVLAVCPALLRSADHTTDTPEEVKKALAAGKAVLLDVREQEEWDEGHLKDAKLLPLSTLKGGAKAEDVAKVAPKDKIVYVHCASGRRVLKAADELKTLGYDVRPLKLGYKDLLKAGFEPAEKK